MTYTWEILKLGHADRENDNGETLSQAVIFVKWRKIATNNDGVKASYVSSTKLSVAGTSAADFVALSDVDKATVVGWIEGKLSEAEIQTINNILAKKIETNTTTMIKPNWG